MPDTLLTFLEGIKGITFLKSLVYLFFVIHKIKKMFHQISWITTKQAHGFKTEMSLL